MASMSRAPRGGGRTSALAPTTAQHYYDSAVACLESNKDLPSSRSPYCTTDGSATTAAAPTGGIHRAVSGAPLSQGTPSAFSNGAVLRPSAGGISSRQMYSVDYDFNESRRYGPVKGGAIERTVPIHIEKGYGSNHSATTSSTTNRTATLSNSPANSHFYPIQDSLPKVTSNSQDISLSSQCDGQQQANSSDHHKQGTSPSLGQVNCPTPEASSVDPHHKLKRGISNTVENVPLVSKVRNDVLQDIEESSHDHMYTQTFVLPDLSVYSEDFRMFLERDLVETSTLVSLEQAGRLNWWSTVGVCQRLMPMATTGDGNCLLHAASLAMWGVQDRDLILRKALYDTMTKEIYRGALYRRWRWQQTLLNKESGLIFSEDEWKSEWSNLLKLASPKPRSIMSTTTGSASSPSSSPSSQANQSLKSPSGTSPVVYESLEEFHVFVLAHVLQRPIIVVADTVLRDANGEALAPIPFGGIYLPLECDCHTSNHTPLLLTYDAAHFSALVPMATDCYSDKLSECSAAIPLVDPNFELLPIHFPNDPTDKINWKMHEKNPQPSELGLDERLLLLQNYLELDWLPMTHPNELEDTECMDQKSCGSHESDQSDVSSCGGSVSGNTTAKEKKKDLKEKRMSQQMQTVAKQFGSIGKSMGKKLKKNFSIGKSGKLLPPEVGEKLSRPTSVGGGVTQSTKLTISIAMFLERDKVLCAKLSTNKTSVQKELIRNYLFNANKRFEKEVESRRKREEEGFGRGAVNRRERSCLPTKCVTTDCNMYGTVETSYLCSKCYSQQKQQAMNQEKSKSQVGGIYNTYPCHGKWSEQIPAPMYAQTHSKSKFFTSAMDKGCNTIPTTSVGMVTRSVPEQQRGSQTLPATFGKQRPSSLEFLAGGGGSTNSYGGEDVDADLNSEMKQLSTNIPSHEDITIVTSTTTSTSIATTTVTSSTTAATSTTTVSSSCEFTPVQPQLALNERGLPIVVNNNQPCCRTPSPDYDNVDYLSFKKNNLNQAESVMDCANKTSLLYVSGVDGANTPIHCLTKGCEFYGSLDRNSLCSKCYRESTKSDAICHPAKPGKI
ncbi:OTU domain-containing protein 7B isoform X2 [Octopus sinensis]|nr:OTU domain-containing protein 7B isoform X2 [Octopus sinensis]XP_029649696.1 OTU domain-containing protein 7B isoform X2 [Octopus sinensis]